MRDLLLGGRYRLVRQLGVGGMGQAWEAQDETLGRPVAVKVISLPADGGSRGDEARARFLREARITARLQHPNVVTIHDLGETGAESNRVPFLVMELVRGEGLEAKLRRGAVALPDAARWGARICDALAEAHNAGIMHRDIKPANILVTPSDIVKVLDFGIARAADPYATADRLTRTGFIVGTPAYMAPEQARGFPELRSDLYAVGCLLFELITGRLPFQAPDTMGYLSAHLTQEPPAPSSVSTDIPPAWDHLVLTLLHKDPYQRYPNAADLSRALRQIDHTPGPESRDGRTRLLTVSPHRPRSSESGGRDRADVTLTVDALLPQEFVNDVAIRFARIAAGTHHPREAGPDHLAEELTRRDCTEVVAGVYAEQPGPHATPENPVYVSVQVFAFPDAKTSLDAFEYLRGAARWDLTIWRARDGGGLEPCPDEVYRSYRWSHSWRRHSYVTVTLAYRADLTNDGSIRPWLAAAARRAAISAAPQNHHGS
ncbi:serine/threonine-protein kinase [Embleya hyalina]|uniref:non-specific serine/threonine protein kinase n=1 Tax=Embleya hyalina TaxID=516124 RepID=A0A401Z2D6_9ACTN|nr:serine/threonine-protein kinase [Embleya hyalina]GCE01020.1 serine/threonine-protein kinase PksC [Embleya hyalina]